MNIELTPRSEAEVTKPEIRIEADSIAAEVCWKQKFRSLWLKEGDKKEEHKILSENG